MRGFLAISFLATSSLLLIFIMVSEPATGSPLPSKEGTILLRRSSSKGDGNGSGSSSNKNGKGDQSGSVKDKTQAEKDNTKKEVHDYIEKQKADQNKIWGGSKERPQPWQSPPYSYHKGSKS